MIAMDVKGITWVGNIYQKFENMCLEAEDVICEDAVKYIENQMQTVGASVKKLYSDVMRDFIPPSSCDSDEKVASEFSVDQCTDAGFFEKPFQGFKVKPIKEAAIQNDDSRIDHDVDNAAIHAASDDENQANKRMAATEVFDEITLAETDANRASQSCEHSNENRNRAVGDSNPALAEVTRVASLADRCNEIENSRTEIFSNAPVFIKSSEGKHVNASSSSDALFGATNDGTIQSDDCSHSMVVVSHPEEHKTTLRQDHLKLEENCVMVTGDELKAIPNAGGDVKTNKKKKKRRQAFSLSNKAVRKQEYEELAAWHGNSDKLRGDCVEDRMKSPLPSMSEPEWELL